MAALKLITSGVSFFSHALMAARKRDDVQSYTDASHFTEEMSCQLLPQRGSSDDLRLALGARAFPPGPKRLWIIIVNIIIYGPSYPRTPFYVRTLVPLVPPYPRTPFYADYPSDGGSRASEPAPKSTQKRV